LPFGGAEIDAVALVGKQSVRFKSTLRLLVADWPRIALTKCLNKIRTGRLYFEERRCALMTTVGTVYPAQVLVVEAEIRLVADQTQNGAPVTIKPTSKLWSTRKK
jgi:hypothetical protein